MTDSEERAQIFTGRDPGNPDTEILVTVWPDGLATIAYRGDGERSWGPEHRLTPAP